MAWPKPQYVTNLLVQLGVNPELKKLTDILFKVLKAKIIAASDEEISDYIERYKEDIARELFIKKTEAVIDGIELNFEIVPEEEEYYIKFYDKPEIQFLRKVQSNTPENFELLCGQILTKLGGSSSVSGGSNDGGVDFTSFDLSLKALPGVSTKGSKIFVIGQAKRYTGGNHVTEIELRQFIGASIRRMEELKRTRAEHYGIFQPTILAFWTTSDFHIEAKKFAREFGIWYLNGIALSQLAIKLGLTTD